LYINPNAIVVFSKQINAKVNGQETKNRKEKKSISEGREERQKRHDGLPVRTNYIKFS